MDPTFTLTIPLTLLSRTEILNPATHFPISSRATLPLHYLYTTLVHYCPDIPIHLHIPSVSQSGEDEDIGATWVLRPSNEHTLSLKERELLPKNTYACSFTLTRSLIPLATTSLSYHTFATQLTSLFSLLHCMHFLHGTWPNLGDNVRLWSILAPLTTPLSITLVPSLGCALDEGFVKRGVMMLVGVEREGVGCGMVEAGVVSRWLEGILVGSDKEMGTEGRVRRTRGRRAEWFDVVHDMDTALLLACLRDGVGVKCDVAHDRTLKGLTFQTHPATFQADEILFYTALVASMTSIAHELDMDELVEWVEGYREKAPAPPSPTHGLQYLAKALRILALPASYRPDQHAESGDDEEEDPIANPFSKLTAHVEKEGKRRRAYMPVFVQRYEEAGGFWPTSAEKVEALRVADGWRRLKESDEKERKEKEDRMEEDGGEVQRSSNVDTLEVEERNVGLKARVLEGLKR
jgi:hypothetical protein